MTTKEPSNVIDPEILISVEQPEIEDYDNLCVSNTFCFICYVSLVSAGLFLIGIIILILSQYN